MPPRKKATTDASGSAQPTRVSARNQAKAAVASSAPAPDLPAATASSDGPDSQTKAPVSKAKAPTSKAKAPTSKAKATVSKGKGKRVLNEDEDEEDETSKDEPKTKKIKLDDDTDDKGDKMDDQPAEPPKKMISCSVLRFFYMLTLLLGYGC